MENTDQNSQNHNHLSAATPSATAPATAEAAQATTETAQTTAETAPATNEAAQTRSSTPTDSATAAHSSASVSSAPDANSASSLKADLVTDSSDAHDRKESTSSTAPTPAETEAAAAPNAAAAAADTGTAAAMSQGELLRRIVVFLFSVSVCGCGVAVFAQAQIGVTPISSLNYVISLHCPMTLGGVTFIFNAALMVLQYFLLTKPERNARNIRAILLQLPVTVLFSLAIDGSTLLLESLLSTFIPLPYYISMGLALLGSLFLGVGITLQVLANVAMVSGEAVVKLISLRLKREFGTIKLGFDLTLVGLAVITSFFCTGFTTIEGVREGTIIGALLVGPLIRILMPYLKVVNRFFYGRSARTQHTAQLKAQAEQFHGVITIAREYGCGGRIIGQEIARQLKLNFYDNELITPIAQESGFSPEYVAENAGQLDSNLLFQMIFKDYSVPLEKSLSPQDALFVACSRVIRTLALKESCVIVGRAADFILRDNTRCLNVLLYASHEEYKLRFCQDNYHEDEATAKSHMTHYDRTRNEYHLQYTGTTLRDPRNYDLCLDVSVLGPKQCQELIIMAYRNLQEHPKTFTRHSSNTIAEVNLTPVSR